MLSVADGYVADVQHCKPRGFKSNWFLFKKLFLITFISLSIAEGTVALLDIDIDPIEDPFKVAVKDLIRYSVTPCDVKQEDMDIYKVLTQNTFVTFLTIGIVLESVSLYGIVRQNTCISTSYALMMLLAAVLFTMAAFNRITGWLDALFATLIALTAFSYVRDLRKIRIIRLRFGIDVI